MTTSPCGSPSLGTAASDSHLTVLDGGAQARMANPIAGSLTPHATTQVQASTTASVAVVLCRHGEHITWPDNGHAPGLLTAALRPRSGAPALVAALAHDLLSALGHEGVRAIDSTADVTRAALSTYLNAHQIKTVVVRGAERLTTESGFAAIRDALATRVRLWLVVEHAGDVHDLAANSGVTARPLADLKLAMEGSTDLPMCPAPWCSRSKEPSRLRATSNRQAAFPPVPGDEALTFLDSVDQLLAPADAARVREATWAAADRATAICGPRLPGGPRHTPGRGPAASELVFHQVRLEVGQAGDVNEAVARARGVQLALFNLGWWLTVDIDDFVEVYRSTPRAQIADPGAWSRLSAYRTPLVGAVAALTAAGVSRAGLEQLPAAAVAPDGSVAWEGWRLHPVPAPAQFFLRAQHALISAHAVPGQPTRFTSVLGPSGCLVPATTSQVSGALAAPGADLHARFTGRPRAWAHRGESAWGRRWALGLYPIGASQRQVRR